MGLDSIGPDSVVRQFHDPAAVGVVERITTNGARKYAIVRFPGGKRRLPVEQLELVPFRGEGPLDLLAAGRLTDPSRLRQVLAHVRLTGRLADMIYSMEATNTDFHAHQFKPVLKFLGSPGGGMLIADEVGLGKTIEAGLIWTELRARYDTRRLLVVCPKVLTRKWQTELGGKFGIDADILDAKGLLELLGDARRVARGFAVICGLPGIRPPRGWDNDSAPPQSPAARLARFLDECATREPMVDLLVIDEAHHLRNLETQSHRLGELLRPIAEHRVFLSATPINLQNRDLFALLRLLDPDNVAGEWQFAQILKANTPLVRARDLALAPTSTVGLLQAELARAADEPLLADSQQLGLLRQELHDASDPLPPAARAKIANRLEQINLLANVVTRTRRRDVEELRVVRQVYPERVEFHPIERAAYDAVTAEVCRYASEVAAHERFLLATPQRLLSSCLPAAVEHWRAQHADPGDEDEDTLPEDVEALDQRPLVACIAACCRTLPPPAELERADTKFARFREVVRAYLAEAPGEKIVVFSSFKPTLNYLGRRLLASGIACELMHGDVKEDRSEIIARFAGPDGPSVLLSSEIGSEGIDLQFCRAMVNYDLPWNPMRVEQRIGRIDRLGQASKHVVIWNLIHKHTIDQRIYDRLYDRLKLCESALGGFEEILGAELRTLSAGLLNSKLSEADQMRLIDQAAMAVEQRRSMEMTLEQEAASLLAHGDFILQSVQRARELHRWIAPADLIAYIRDTLSSLHPGCGVRAVDEDRCEITLTDAAREDFAQWASERSEPDPGRLLADRGPVLFQLGRQAGAQRRGGRAERLPQTHPFVRFLADRLGKTEAPRLRPAVAATVGAGDLRRQLSPGQYVLMVQRWEFRGDTTEERLGYAAIALDEADPIDDDDAEALAIAAGSAGRYWAEASTSTAMQLARTQADEHLVPRLMERFEGFERAKRVEQEDRVAIQRRAIEAGRTRDLERLNAQLANHQNAGRTSLVAATKGRIEAMERRFRQRLAKIEPGLPMPSGCEDLAVALIEVRP